MFQRKKGSSFKKSLGFKSLCLSISISMGMSVGLTACTGEMWAMTKSLKTFEGKDTIRSMLMSKDGKFVVLGDRYHYVFDSKLHNNHIIAKRLGDKLRPFYTADFHACKINHINQSVSCEVGLGVDASKLSQTQKNHARELGFFPAKSSYLTMPVSNNMFAKQNNDSLWVAEAKVQGKFYRGDEKVTAAAKQLNHTYTISVSETMNQTNPALAALAAIATPVTLVGDGLLSLGVYALFSLPGMKFCVVC